MKKINIDFETKLLLDQAQFEQRKLQLEMQMKEIETKRSLVEREGELEQERRNMKLENDGAGSQLTNAQNK